MNTNEYQRISMSINAYQCAYAMLSASPRWNVDFRLCNYPGTNNLGTVIPTPLQVNGKQHCLEHVVQRAFDSRHLLATQQCHPQLHPLR